MKSNLPRKKRPPCRRTHVSASIQGLAGLAGLGLPPLPLWATTPASAAPQQQTKPSDQLLADGLRFAVRLVAEYPQVAIYGGVGLILLGVLLCNNDSLS